MASLPSPDLAHFLSIPWCASLLSKPDTTILPSPSPNRTPKSSTEDALFAETFKTPNTISAVLSYCTPSGPASRTQDVHTLMSLGYGLNGYPDVVHGGILATIIDEAMGVFLTQNREVSGIRATGDLVTADLRVQFLRKVVTPQTVLVSVRLGEVKGRKYNVEAVVVDEAGVELAKGFALWVEVKASL